MATKNPFTGTSSALRFLKEHGASDRLLLHATLVGEAAEELIRHFQHVGVPLDAAFVHVGAALHDAGKIVHREELDAAGNRHERAGEELLLRCGCDPAVARVCVSHAQWRAIDCSLEELLVALADNLWKGRRNEALEARIVDAVARSLGRETWEAFRDLDACFEAIASRGAERLLATRQAR